MDWSCPICYQTLNDPGIVPCVLSSCESATHPICLDCCERMRRAEPAFRCPMCTRPAGLVLPLHCMLDPADRPRCERAARAEAELAWAKSAANDEIKATRLRLEQTRLCMHLLLKPLSVLIVFLIGFYFSLYVLSEFFLRTVMHSIELLRALLAITPSGFFALMCVMAFCCELHKHRCLNAHEEAAAEK